MTIAFLILSYIGLGLSYYVLYRAKKTNFTLTEKQLPPIGKRVLLKRKTVPVYVMGARISTDKWTDDLCHATPPRDASEIEAWRDVT